MNFPIYRKYSDGRTLYKITDLQSFEELKKLGERWLHSHLQVQKFHDRLTLDRLLNMGEGVLESSFKEWESAFSNSV